MKKAIYKIAAFITTIIFYWGIIADRNINDPHNKRQSPRFWPELKEVQDLPQTFFFGLVAQLCLFSILGMIFGNLVSALLFLAFVGLLVALFYGTIQFTRKNVDKDG